MRKEVEDWDSPKRSIRDSGYIDCWESERSDSLSPSRHARDDSFDSLDSIGSRSRHTPSPDGLFARGSSDGRGSDSDCDIPYRKLPDMRRDDMLARRTSCSEPRTVVPFNQYLPNKSNQASYVPIPMRRQRTEREESCKSWSSATSPIGGERSFRFGRSDSVFDDPESVSMIDVRTEDDGLLPPHSRVRHELMHGQYNRMKEEDSQWQDDLARWKSRRRSVSQDLIKKEEERKTVERLLSHEDVSQRRKSFKTYREIVEDKERRERELHETYLKARTPEEAAAVLQRYAQRFTISEAVLEHLKLPHALERSISADPTCSSSSSNDTAVSSSSSSSTFNPLLYLRQQSLPAQKFTATVEARVTGYRAEHVAVGREGGGSAQSNRSIPLLSAKPDNHVRAPKQDKMERVNGETDNDHNAGNKREWGVEREREDEDEQKNTSPLLFYPSPSQNNVSDSSEIEAADSLSSDKQAHTLAVDTGGFESVEGHRLFPGSERQEEEEKQPEETLSQATFLLKQSQSEEKSVPQARSRATTPNQKESQAKENDTCPEEIPVESLDSVSVSQTEHGPQASSHVNTTETQVSETVQEPSVRTSNPPSQSNQAHPTSRCVPGLHITEPVDKPHGNEKYQREQQRLKQEWEKAQKEVEEEERKYHEEERKILEETMAPLTPNSPLLPSPSYKESALIQNSIIRDWDHKQVQLEKEMMETLANEKQMENGTPQKSSFDQLLGQTNGRLGGEARGQNKGSEHMHSSQDVSWTTKQHQQHLPSEPWQKNAPQNSNRTIQQAPGHRKRSVSGKKLCSSCNHPLGKGAAMIIETLSLYFHIQCFKCGVCNGQLGDTVTGTDVRIRNGLLNCHQCYIRSRCPVIPNDASG